MQREYDSIESELFFGNRKHIIDGVINTQSKHVRICGTRLSFIQSFSRRVLHILRWFLLSIGVTVSEVSCSYLAITVNLFQSSVCIMLVMIEFGEIV